MKRSELDLTAYLVVGPENTLGRPVEDIVRAAVSAGFSCVQVRSKTASARELISLCRTCRGVLEDLSAAHTALLVDDRLDVVLAARERGIAVDGIHVGQSDIPVDICRKLLGAESIVGLSAPTTELIRYAKEKDLSAVDYLGAGPLHETSSKPEAGRLADGTMVTRTMGELSELSRVSPVPVVVGGGVKTRDLAALKKTGVDGFFVISAVAGAQDPGKAAREMVMTWKNS